MTRTIPAVKARTHLGEIMRRSFKKRERFIVEKSGIPMVAILNATEYQQIVEEREERFRILEKIKSKLPTVPEEEIQKDVAQAIHSVRKKHA